MPRRSLERGTGGVTAALLRNKIDSRACSRRTAVRRRGDLSARRVPGEALERQARPVKHGSDVSRAERKTVNLSAMRAGQHKLARPQILELPASFGTS
jgi:hypothetical protein